VAIASARRGTEGVRTRAQIRLLPDGKRLHLSDGPIDIVLRAFGTHDQVEHAYRAAGERFGSVLDELCGELALLREPVRSGFEVPHGAMARRMFDAVLPYGKDFFITPMAAVAGAVAEEILACMVAGSQLQRAYVNDGGDIALHIGEGESFAIGMVDCADMFGTMRLDSAQPIRGIATSGWRGRSFSLGIADAVTVLARRAAMADAAATIIANAVDLPGHGAVKRRTARELSPDSDLRDRLVTVDVAPLESAAIDEALGYGAKCARSLLEENLIDAAAIHLQGETRVVSRVENQREANRCVLGLKRPVSLHAGSLAALESTRGLRYDAL
jgi:uncharacterized protein